MGYNHWNIYYISCKYNFLYQCDVIKINYVTLPRISENNKNSWTQQYYFLSLSFKMIFHFLHPLFSPGILCCVPLPVFPCMARLPALSHHLPLLPLLPVHLTAWAWGEHFLVKSSPLPLVHWFDDVWLSLVEMVHSVAATLCTISNSLLLRQHSYAIKNQLW